ncbi:MAG: photosystem I reaction center subunit X [Snowella sp.]|nr:photosystem I reaction center subunit X [Snowella sp.]
MINTNAFELSLEQQFQLQCLQQEFHLLDRDAVISHLLDAMEQLMVRDNLIRDLVKKSPL